MELYIQIRDGQPHEHPIMGDNFREAFPHIDVNNLPPEFAKFERIEKPNTAGVFAVEEVFYQWVDGVVKDVWTARPMTTEEKSQKEQLLTQAANEALVKLKLMAQERIDTEELDTVKQGWQTYLSQLDAWVLTDFLNFNFPIPPRFSEDGTLLTTSMSGSAPNVVG